LATTDLLEYSRLELQKRLDSTKIKRKRNKLGQFATPTVLATQILEFAKSLLQPDLNVNFLDPAFGTGAFYSALLKTFSQSRIATAVGYEIDPDYGKNAIELWRDTPLQLHITDFTQAKSPESDEGKFNLLICNPPYVRHHHLTRQEKNRLKQDVKTSVDLKLNGLAGLYCYFLCLSHDWMAQGGLAGWLIPSEFMAVNYGKKIKQYLLTRVKLLRVHRFDPTDVQFKDALVSSAVVWFENKQPPVEHSVEFTYGGTLLKPAVSKSIPIDVLRYVTKWTKFPLFFEGSCSGQTQTRLMDLFEIKRGLATGANNFFVLTPEEAAKHQLPNKFLKPVLPPPRYLPVNKVETDNEGNPTLGHNLLLLDCNLPEDVVRNEFPKLWRYLQTGVAAGINQRYLCSHRSPWYSQENRPPSPFLCTYSGRRGTKNRNPFRFILNYSNATATNGFLMLYPRRALRRALECNFNLQEDIWHALNRISSHVLIEEGRVYGGGLYKLEPKELGNVPADKVLAVLPEPLTTLIN